MESINATRSPDTEAEILARTEKADTNGEEYLALKQNSETDATRYMAVRSPLAHRKLPTFRPNFTSRPKLRTRPYLEQLRILEETQNENYPITNPLTLPSFHNDEQIPASRQRRKRPLPADWYIPKEFPYTHTHIEELRDWPQRLLHVKSMTSYEWQPGNIYGSYANPAYRAVSYTWGRWKLADDESTTSPLDVRNVPWKIPRTSPSHYTTSQVEHMLRYVCTIEPAVDFVWFDIACIDQRRGPAASREIGRQAAIFRRASSMAIWLSRTGLDGRESIERLTRRLRGLGTLASLLRLARTNPNDDEVRSKLYFNEPEQIDILDGVAEMLCDPWFTGLWTLQEAFLATKAFFILAHEGLLVSHEPSPLPMVPRSSLRIESTLYTLGEFAESCRQLLRYSANKQLFASCDGLDAFRAELTTWVQVSGLRAMARNGSPLDLLAIACHRQARREEDEIYGIIQVFGYRIGSTRADAKTDEVYDRKELELELGATLLQDRQAQSQLFVFREPPELGQGWRINGSCHVHHDFQSLFDWGRVQENGGTCQFSTREVGQILFGHFCGRLCSFGGFNKAWNEYEDSNRLHEGTLSWTGFRRFYPDTSTLFADSVEYQPPIIYIPEEPERHRAFGKYLEARFGTNSIKILYLGCHREQHIGMLLLPLQVGGFAYCHRLGILMWYLGQCNQPAFMTNESFQTQTSSQGSPGLPTSSRADGLGKLSGTGDLWQVGQGIYG
ncbi:hypothetical protein GGR57DRAFT_510946 [Xylariaceae sp. FL1272]|nr:hypothetical protein GGR57DRAFT_510946 [Xylariaceae sp. FL1272]